MKQRLTAAAVTLIMSVLTFESVHAAGTNIPTEFWISTNATGNFITAGAGGTLDDPLDGSSQFNFDTNMNNLPPNSTIHILAGTYQTGGSRAWGVQSGQKILGSGIDVTILQLPAGISLNRAVIGSVDGGTNMEVADMTCDCNYTSGAYSFDGVDLDGTGNAIRRVKVIHCANYWPGGIECWGIVLQNFFLPDSTGNIVEDCEVSHFSGGAAGEDAMDGISLNGAAGHSISAIVRDNHVISNDGTNLVGMGFNGSFVHDSIYEGNLVENASSGFYGDTGGDTNLYVAHNFFKNCVLGIYQTGPYMRNNVTYAYNVIQLAPFTGSAQWVFSISYGTNINVIGNTAYWPNPGPANSGYFFALNDSDVSGFLATGNRVDASLTNEYAGAGYTGIYELYDNYDLNGNYRTDMSIPTLGGVLVSTLGLDFVSATSISTVLTNIGLPAVPTELLTNNSSGVTLSGTFSGDGSGLTNLTGSANFASVVTPILASDSGQNAVNRGVVLDLDFQVDDADAANGAAYYDRSPNFYTAYFVNGVTNPPYIPSPDGIGIKFLPSFLSALVVSTNIGYSLDGLTNFTADFLIQNTNPGSIDYPIAFQSPTTADPFQFYYANSGYYGFKITTTSGSYLAQTWSPAGLADGNWHDICLTYNGSSANIYVDGALSVSTAASGAFTNVLSQLQIGSNNNDGLAHVRMWKRTLSTNEIYNLAANRGLAAVLTGNGAGITNIVNFATNAAPTGIVWGTTPPDYWVRLTNSATGGPMWMPCWTNH